MPMITFVIMMSIGDAMGGFGSFIVLRVGLTTQALIAFIAATMTNTAEWDRRSQNASIGQWCLEKKSEYVDTSGKESVLL